jgi:peptidoglycan/LPS O-acetylase OafA/YrhL
MVSRAQRNPALDALRGAAIALVVIFHYLGPAVPPPQLDGPASWLATLASLAWTGVDLFFVLSGYLIGGILIDNRRAGNLFGVFYLRRAARILPLYLPAIGLAFWLSRERSDPTALPYLLTFTQNLWMAGHGAFPSGALNVTWSLAIEEQFYLVAPFLIRLLPLSLLPAVLAGLIALAPALRGLVWLTYPPGHEWLAAYVLPWTRMDSIAAGVLLAAILRHPVLGPWLLARRRAAASAAAACGALAIAMVFSGHSWREPIFSILGFTLVGAAWTGVLLVVLTRGRAWRPLFAVCAPIGLGAYSIYLFHPYAPELVRSLVGPAALPRLGSFLLMCGMDLVLALLLWTLVERRFIQLGQGAHYRLAPGHPEAAPSEGSLHLPRLIG